MIIYYVTSTDGTEAELRTWDYLRTGNVRSQLFVSQAPNRNKIEIYEWILNYYRIMKKVNNNHNACCFDYINSIWICYNPAQAGGSHWHCSHCESNANAESLLSFPAFRSDLFATKIMTIQYIWTSLDHLLPSASPCHCHPSGQGSGPHVKSNYDNFKRIYLCWHSQLLL